MISHDRNRASIGIEMTAFEREHDGQKLLFYGRKASFRVC